MHCLSRNRLENLVCRKFGKEYRKENIKNHVADQIEEKEINKGLWAFLPQFFQPEVLGLLAHGDHEFAFTVMAKEKTDGVIHLFIKGQKSFL